MKMTIGEALDKIDSMRRIVHDIAVGNPINDIALNDIADYLDEYIMILSNTKVDV